MIVFEVKVSRGTLLFSSMGVDSADCGHCQVPTVYLGKICMDSPHLLPYNSARH